MKRFLRDIALFLLPVAMVAIALEWIAESIPNSYTYKHEYMELHGGELKTLILGSSNAYDGINPSVFGIDPVVFPTEYMTEERSEANKPYLIDGGVYDNQGCHKFSEPNSSFKVDYSIISLAENDKYEYAHYNNSITLLARVINLALNRIDKLQEARNMYATDNSKQRSAYVVLKWNDDLSKIPLRFLQNAQDGYVPMKVMKYHGFDEADFQVLKNLKEKENTNKAEASSIFNGYLERVKESIGWKKLFEERPKLNEVKEAYEVVTFLTGLSDSEIYSLGRFSEWMTEVQCKLYLPNLL